MYRFIDEKGEHLHTFDGKPLLGTSTITGVLAKPLKWWASGLAVAELGWIKKADPRKVPQNEIVANDLHRLAAATKSLEQIKEMKASEYLALLDKAYRAHADSLTKSADKGTDMHAELEKYVRACIENCGSPIGGVWIHPAVKAFAEWAIENVKTFIASEAHCYSEKMWTGGITDCIFEDKQDRVAIMDFKSSKEAYLSQFIQVAGYDLQIEENGIFDANGKFIGKVDQVQYYAVFPFGMENPEPSFNFETAGLRNGFKACVVLYKLQNKN